MHFRAVSFSRGGVNRRLSDELRFLKSSLQIRWHFVSHRRVLSAHVTAAGYSYLPSLFAWQKPHRALGGNWDRRHLASPTSAIQLSHIISSVWGPLTQKLRGLRGPSHPPKAPSIRQNQLTPSSLASLSGGRSRMKGVAWACPSQWNATTKVFNTSPPSPDLHLEVKTAPTDCANVMTLHIWFPRGWRGFSWNSISLKVICFKRVCKKPCPCSTLEMNGAALIPNDKTSGGWFLRSDGIAVAPAFSLSKHFVLTRITGRNLTCVVLLSHTVNNGLKVEPASSHGVVWLGMSPRSRSRCLR